MPKKAILAGGSGFLGSALARRLVREDWEPVVLTRAPGKDPGPVAGVRYVAWDARTAGDWANELDGAAAVVNFTGRNVNAAPTPSNRRAILESRLASVHALAQAVARARRRPQVWVQCSGVGYYGPRGTEPCDEATPPGADFLADVCRRWEAAFAAGCPADTRSVVLRLGLVLGRDGGAFPLLVRLARAGLGGSAGHGRQGMSWVHVDDVVAVMMRALGDGLLQGAFNATAPEPVANVEFMRALRRAVHRPWSPPAPAFAVRLAARFILRTDPSLILDGQYAGPARLQAAGFPFLHPRLEDALRDLLGDRHRGLQPGDRSANE